MEMYLPEIIACIDKSIAVFFDSAISVYNTALLIDEQELCCTSIQVGAHSRRCMSDGTVVS